MTGPGLYTREAPGAFCTPPDEAKGDRIQTWLNDIAIADVQDDLTSTGYIALQLHGIGNNKYRSARQ